jgi:1-acyl-sn-glycerol-3-phosphate acyltransferase
MHDEPGEVPLLVRPSRPLLSLIDKYLPWYIGRHFNAMRIANPGRFPRTNGPLIVYGNHSSWWDTLAFLVLSRYFLPGADHYAPMEGATLQHYGLFRKMGIFPVDPGTRRGAVQFLRAAYEIFSTPNSVLWLTPEAQFNDVRTRPAIFRRGLATHVSRVGACTLVPLAFEYTFWNERLPNMLIGCGHPIMADGGQLSATEWSEHLTAALANTQDELAALSMLRDPKRFETIVNGRVGVSIVYDAWKRLRALLTGRVYQGSHGSIGRE